MSVPYRIAVVCTGNICRSPMGEIVLRQMLDDADVTGVEVSSAGTAGWHIGDGADRRAIRLMRERGYDASEHRARQFTPGWFEQLDLVLAADEGHLRQLQGMISSPADREKIRLLREFDAEAVEAGTLDVDDPYYGDMSDFEQCLAEVEAACRGVVEHVRDIQIARSAPPAGDEAP